MSIKVEIQAKQCRVVTTGKNGTETAILIENDKALSEDQALRCFKQAAKAAGSMRAASVTLINNIQRSGVLKPWFGGLKVTADFLKKMREAEDKYFAELGLTEEQVTELRKPGSYADTRSHAMKCWSFGVPVLAGETEDGEAMLLTTSAMRKIVAQFRKTPEPKGVEDYLSALEDYLLENPSEFDEAAERLEHLLEKGKIRLRDLRLQVMAQADGQEVKQVAEVLEAA